MALHDNRHTQSVIFRRPAFPDIAVNAISFYHHHPVRLVGIIDIRCLTLGALPAM